MLGYVVKKVRRQDRGPTVDLVIPADLRRRLTAWIDVDEVGAEGFWLWFRAVLPLLPRPPAHPKGPPWADDSSSQSLRELKRRVVLYAREHSRLMVVCDQYARDNETLARRLRALEAALRTVEMAGLTVESPVDPDAGEIANRYLRPRRGP